MKNKKIIYLLLVISWMIAVFFFSSELSDDSSATSGNTIRAILNISSTYRNLTYEQKEKIVDFLQPIARKLAHLSLYLVGGVVISLFVNEFNIKEKNKILYSILFGFLYSITDEIHQTFIPRKSRANN